MRVRAANVAFRAKGLSLTPPPLDPIGYLISANDKIFSFGGQRSMQLRCRVSKSFWDKTGVAAQSCRPYATVLPPVDLTFTSTMNPFL